MALWLKNKKDTDGWVFYPECSNCGYHWIETVVGEVGKGHSNIVDANYCPKCGSKMTGVVDYDEFLESVKI